MAEISSKERKPTEIDPYPNLKFLTPSQLSMIDEALSNLGDYGEVRLIVEKGRLRFIVTQKSYDVLKWQPGEVKQG
jgi:hypothetical protein